nr:hypothetical protein [Thermoproteus tenax]
MPLVTLSVPNITRLMPASQASASRRSMSRSVTPGTTGLTKRATEPPLFISSSAPLILSTGLGALGSSLPSASVTLMSTSAEYLANSAGGGYLVETWMGFPRLSAMAAIYPSANPLVSGRNGSVTEPTATRVPRSPTATYGLAANA